MRREGKRALATKAHLTLYSQHFKPESQSCYRSLACHVMLERIVFHGSMRLGKKKTLIEHISNVSVEGKGILSLPPPQCPIFRFSPPPPPFPSLLCLLRILGKQGQSVSNPLANFADFKNSKKNVPRRTTISFYSTLSLSRTHKRQVAKIAAPSLTDRVQEKF